MPVGGITQVPSGACVQYNSIVWRRGGIVGANNHSPLPHTSHMYPAGRVMHAPSGFAPGVSIHPGLRLRPGLRPGLSSPGPTGRMDVPLRGYASPSLPTVKEAGSQRACTPTNPCG